MYSKNLLDTYYYLRKTKLVAKLQTTTHPIKATSLSKLIYLAVRSLVAVYIYLDFVMILMHHLNSHACHLETYYCPFLWLGLLRAMAIEDVMPSRPSRIFNANADALHLHHPSLDLVIRATRLAYLRTVPRLWRLER